MDSQSNPFLKPITPAAQTDVDQNAALFEAVLGSEEADRYRALVAGENRQPRQKAVDVGARAKEALASKQDLFEAVVKSRMERFFKVDLPIKFEEQAEHLIELGFLETNEKGEKGVTGIDGKFYTLPTPEQVVAYFTAPEHKAFFERKAEEGFTRLLITPFAATMESLAEQASRVLLNYRGGKNPTKIELIESDRDGHLFYEVTKFDKTNHGGKTKRQLLSESSQPFPGFRIQFLQEDLIVPRAGQGTTIKNRPALEAGEEAKKYLKMFQDPTSPYYNEHGLIPEDWLTLFTTTLDKTNTVIDDFADGKTAATYLTGCYDIKTPYDVPTAQWNRGYGEAFAGLYRRLRSQDNPDFGVRTAVS
ncbi:MAG: hypothetical protein NT003_03490 [Candidatus Magasanikbacteria bacterium]|nr:hypothetical protein [Candidatus Magasanikbacteria bacterium]